MNKIVQSVIAATAAILLLAGCSAGSAEAQAAPEPSVSATPSDAANATLTPDAEPTAPVVKDADSLYLKEVRIRLKAMDSTSDADLIAAGHKACDLYAQGQKRESIDIIEGDAPGEPFPGANDLAIATWAAKAYCQEYDELK